MAKRRYPAHHDHVDEEELTVAAMRNASLTVQVSTKLNRSHLVAGRTALILPTATTEAKVVEHLFRDRVVTITASPGRGLEATLRLCERLAAHGYPVVPHLGRTRASTTT